MAFSKRVDIVKGSNCSNGGSIGHKWPCIQGGTIESLRGEKEACGGLAAIGSDRSYFWLEPGC